MAELGPAFFDRDASLVALELLGCVLEHEVAGHTLRATVIEAESYYAADRGSHAWLGFSASRRALFEPPGTIYMYYARGGDSLNFSCRGAGDAVLVKSALPARNTPEALALMHRLNRAASGGERPHERLCAGQTLLCRALGLKVPELDGLLLPLPHFRVLAPEGGPRAAIQTTRLGIPEGRSEELWQRFVAFDAARWCTRNPLTRRGWREGTHYALIPPGGTPDWSHTVHDAAPS